MIEPVVKEIWVGAGADDAFRRFTDEIADWWPTASHSVSGEACTDVRFEGRVGGRILEEEEGGQVHVWGTVTAWEPPGRVAFTWHPGRRAETAQSVEVEFSPQDGGTRVRLTHTGWERFGDAADQKRGEYDAGWTFVLSRYAEGGA